MKNTDYIRKVLVALRSRAGNLFSSLFTMDAEIHGLILKGVGFNTQSVFMWGIFSKWFILHKCSEAYVVSYTLLKAEQRRAPRWMNIRFGFLLLRFRIPVRIAGLTPLCTQVVECPRTPEHFRGDWNDQNYYFYLCFKMFLPHFSYLL